MNQSRTHSRGMLGLYRLKIGRIWEWVLTQPLSYWFVVLYMFFEYVRPQEIYEPLAGMPFASWAVYLGIGAFILEGPRGRKWNVADTLLILFTGVVVASSLNAYQPERSFGEITLFLSWVVIYGFITLVVSTKARMFVFMLAYLIYCLKMSQFGFRSWATSGFGFSSWGVTCGPSWLHNSGECGIQMSMFLPVAFFFVTALRKYWGKVKTAVMVFIPVSAAATILATSSRGAQLALLGVTAFVAAQQKGRRFKALAAIAILVPIGWVLVPEEQKERFSAMGEDETSQSRLVYWADGLEIMESHPIFGIGYRNWIPYYRTNYGGGEEAGGRGELPHNIFIEAGAELGYSGLLVFVALIGATFWLNYRTRKLAVTLPGDTAFLTAMAQGFDAALVGLMISGFFVTVLYYPFFWINLAMTVALYNSTRNEVKRWRRHRTTPPVARTPRTPVAV